MNLKSVAPLFFILTAFLVTCSGCSPVQFNGLPNPNNNGAFVNGGPNICTPFGGSGGSGNQGLVANGVYYVDVNSLPSNVTPDQAINNSVNEFFDPANPYTNYISEDTANLYLQALNFPAVYFTQGFVDSGGTALTDNTGQTLVQWFGFNAQSVFGPANWTPGQYQIATLTDDGSILTIAGGQSDKTDFVVNNDGTHSMQLGCTQSTLNVTTSSYPMTMKYFQGPPVTIGMMMLYRPVPADGNVQDPLCGLGGNDDSYFFLDHNGTQPINPPQAQAPYQQLTGPYGASQKYSGGWTVVEPAHFTLPGGLTNPCGS